MIFQNVLNKNPRNNLGYFPLHVAALQGHFEIFVVTLSNVQDKNPENDLGLTPLHLAAANGHIGICQYIYGLTDGCKSRGCKWKNSIAQTGSCMSYKVILKSDLITPCIFFY